MKIDPQKRRLALSVGELSSLVADGTANSALPTLALRGKIGSQAHKNHQARQSKNRSYRHEIQLAVNLTDPSPESNQWNVHVRGRIDGLIDEIDRTIIEEIKTVTLPKKRFADLTPVDYPRHQRQLEIYIYLLSKLRPECTISGRLIYINLIDGSKRAFDLPYEFQETEAYIHEAINSLIATKSRQREEAEIKRNLANSIRFPFQTFRPNQEEIVSAVDDALRKKRHFLCEAPTGFGKTVATLFGTLKFALKNDKQVLFLTSKTTQQALAFETARILKSHLDFPRILLLRARQKYCPLPEQKCHPDQCPYLANFQLRFRQSSLRDQLLSKGCVQPDALLELAESETLCPHEVQLAILDEFDLIIGDYNYAFDPACCLTSLFIERDPNRLILLVDEAHNLPDRSRSYYSTSLTLQSLKIACTSADTNSETRFADLFNKISSVFSYYSNAAPETANAHPIQLSLDFWQTTLEEFESIIIPYWLQLIFNEISTDDDPIITLYRDLENFVRILKYEGDNFVHLLKHKPSQEIQIVCLDASEYLKEIFSTVHSAIAMSATLQPFDFSLQQLGLGEDTIERFYPCSFPPENRLIIIDPSVTSIYREREQNYSVFAEKIERFYARNNVKTLSFFPSYEMMREITNLLEVKHLFIQEMGMSDPQRNRLLTAFKGTSKGLFCSVMGGVFSEGIDLPGNFAEAAIIVGVGLPMICTENQARRAYYDRQGNHGFGYVYLIPGMQRVIQAVGRVVRSEKDLAVILLADRRYTQTDYSNLLPSYWYKQSADELINGDWEQTISNFWQESKCDEKRSI